MNPYNPGVVLAALVAVWVAFSAMAEEWPLVHPADAGTLLRPESGPWALFLIEHQYGVPLRAPEGWSVEIVNSRAVIDPHGNWGDWVGYIGTINVRGDYIFYIGIVPDEHAGMDGRREFITDDEEYRLRKDGKDVAAADVFLDIDFEDSVGRWEIAEAVYRSNRTLEDLGTPDLYAFHPLEGRYEGWYLTVAALLGDGDAPPEGRKAELELFFRTSMVP